MTTEIVFEKEALNKENLLEREEKKIVNTPQAEDVFASPPKLTSVFVRPKILEIIKERGYSFKDWIEERFFEWAYGAGNEYYRKQQIQNDIS